MIINNNKTNKKRINRKLIRIKKKKRKNLVDKPNYQRLNLKSNRNSNKREENNKTKIKHKLKHKKRLKNRQSNQQKKLLR
jgi:hypothetical protein